MKIAVIYNKHHESTTGAYIEKVIRNVGIDYEHFWTEFADQLSKEFDLFLAVKVIFILLQEKLIKKIFRVF